MAEEEIKNTTVETTAEATSEVAPKAKTSKGKKGKNKKTARAAAHKQSHDLQAEAAANRSANADQTNGDYDSYAPRNYDFALYQSTAQAGSPTAGNAAETGMHDPLFFENVPEGSEHAAAFGRLAAIRAGNKTMAPSAYGTTPQGLDILRGPDGSQATAGSAFSLTGNHTDQIIRDIATMRANAQYPNPQTDAERLAREQMLARETEKYRQHLRNLYRKSIKDPERPEDNPQPESFEKDVLGKVIIDTTGSDTIKSLNFVESTAGDDQEQDPQQLEQIRKEILEQQLAKNKLSFENLSKEEQEFLTKDMPIIVTLGTTTETTWEEVAQELQRLNKQLRQEEQAAQSEGQQGEQGKNAVSEKTKKYAETLQQFQWLYDHADCGNQKCIWMAGNEQMPGLKDLKKSLTYANAHLVGDPLGLQQEFWKAYQQQALADFRAQHAPQAEEDEDLAILDEAEAAAEAAGDFVEFANYLPYNAQNTKQVNEKFFKATDTQDPSAAANTQTQISSPNSYHTEQLLEEDIPQRNILTSGKSLEQCQDAQDAAGNGFVQSRINQLNYQKGETEYTTAEYAQSMEKLLNSKLKTEKQTNGK